MAGFDWAETQQIGRILGGVKMDMGRFEFSSGSNSYDLATTLANVIGAVVCADLTGTSDQQKTLTAYKAGDVSNGTVTFIRGGPLVDEDARMSYLMWGY